MIADDISHVSLQSGPQCARAPTARACHETRRMFFCDFRASAARTRENVWARDAVKRVVVNAAMLLASAALALEPIESVGAERLQRRQLTNMLAQEAGWNAAAGASRRAAGTRAAATPGLREAAGQRRRAAAPRGDAASANKRAGRAGLLRAASGCFGRATGAGEMACRSFQAPAVICAGWRASARVGPARKSSTRARPPPPRARRPARPPGCARSQHCSHASGRPRRRPGRARAPL